MSDVKPDVVVGWDGNGDPVTLPAAEFGEHPRMSFGKVVVAEADRAELAKALAGAKTGWVSVPAGVEAYQPDPPDLHRRVRAVSLPASHVLDWFIFASKGWPDVVSLPVLSGLPRDVRVLAVHDDPLARSFDFLVAHPSFDPVPEGERPPDFPDRLDQTWRAVRLPKEGCRGQD